MYSTLLSGIILGCIVFINTKADYPWSQCTKGTHMNTHTLAICEVWCKLKSKRQSSLKNYYSHITTSLITSS